MTPTLTPNHDSAHDAELADESCVMAELSIFRVGRRYFYDGYRYERLSDAVAYAQFVQGRAQRAAPRAPS